MTFPVYKGAIYVPRSLDPTETTVLTPSAGAPHTDPFLVATIAGISDGLGSYKPYLVTPTGLRGQVDIRNKTTNTGVMTFELHDPQLPGTDPLSRWFPAFQGDLQGQIRTGGLLSRWWESLDGGTTFAPFWTGRLRVATQVTPIRYALQIRELTDDLAALAFVGRPHPDVTYAALESLLPVAGTSRPMAEKPIIGASLANPTVITTKYKHNYASGDVVSIGGNNATPSTINGDWTITVTGPTTFTIPLNVTVASTAGQGGQVSKYLTSFSSAYGQLRVVPGLKARTTALADGNAVYTSGGVSGGGLVYDYTTQVVVALQAYDMFRWDNLVTQNLMAAAHIVPGDYHLFMEAPGVAQARVRRLDNGKVGYFNCSFSVGPKFSSLLSDGHYRIIYIGLTALDPNEPGFMALSDLPAPTTDNTPAGATIEISIDPGALSMVDASGAVVSTYTLFIGDVHPVTLWRHLLEGKFGFRWAVGETLPPGVNYGDPKLPIAYDAAKFAALEADLTFMPLRFQVKERTPRGQWIQDNILKATNLAFYLDGSGQVVPIDLRQPTTLAGVPTITDADLAQGAPKTWTYDRGQAITRVDAFYYADIQQTTVGHDLNSDPATFPLIPNVGLTELEYPYTWLSTNSDIGDAPFTLKLPGFRTMQGEKMPDGQDRRVVLERKLNALIQDTAQPFGHSAPTIVLSCKRGSNGDAQPGDLRLLSVRSVPDPSSNKLGGTRVVRVLDRAERTAWVDLTVMDLGLNVAANVPTIGVPVLQGANVINGVSVPVTLDAASDPVEIHYALTLTSVGSAPAVGSALWTPLPTGLVKATGNALFSGLASGQRAWVRARSYPQQIAQLPSAWVAASAPGYVDLPALSAPYLPTTSLITSRTWRFGWALALNWVLRSEELDNAAWTPFHTTVVANQIAAPDGLISADQLVEDATTNIHSNRNTTGISIASGEQIAVSVYAKAGTRTKVWLGAGNAGNSFQAFFDLGAGTVISSTASGAGAIVTAGAITAVGNGWYRLTVGGTINGGVVSAFYQIGLLNAAAAQSYLGDGVSAAYFWGAQLERTLTVASDYIKTTTVPAVTNRALEILLASPNTDPLVVVARLAAGSTVFDFPGQTGLVVLPSTSYRCGVRHYLGASISATVTADLTTAAPGTDPPIVLPFPPRLLY